jgi:hypothetical protein
LTPFHTPADDYDFDGIKPLHTSGDRAANVFRINLLPPCSRTIPSVERWSALGNQLRKDAKLTDHAIAIATVPKPEDPMIARHFELLQTFQDRFSKRCQARRHRLQGFHIHVDVRRPVGLTCSPIRRRQKLRLDQ